MNPNAVDASPKEKTARQKSMQRSPLAQLVHALNQPLTGLQCSMEVALARPRTIEQHVFGLREALALTERMRGLMEAIREVADMEETEAAAEEDVAGEQSRDPTAGELENILRETAEDLRPVAAEKNVRIALDFTATPSEFSSAVTPRQSWFAPGMFRLLDSALSLAAAGTVMHIETRMETRMKERIWFRLQWQDEAPRSECSRPELGLLIAQAWLERCGAEWQREESEDDDRTVVTVRRPRAGHRPGPTGSEE
jgi:signal transduction histidine kinase